MVSSMSKMEKVKVGIMWFIIKQDNLLGRDLRQSSSQVAWWLQGWPNLGILLRTLTKCLLNIWLAWDIDHCPRKPLPVLGYALSKEMLPYVQFELSLTQLWTIPAHPVTGSQVEKVSTSLSAFPTREAAGLLQWGLPVSLLFSSRDRPKPSAAPHRTCHICLPCI